MTDVQILEQVVNEAIKATCRRSKCGSIIVSNNHIIGRGVNSPPQNLESQRRCHRKSEIRPGFKSDRTCCIHAEQRAIIDTIQHNPTKIAGASLYFIRLDDHNNPQAAGQPYCTICSKLALDAGLATFSLWSGNGWQTWPTAEYNDLSFMYNGQP